MGEVCLAAHGSMKNAPSRNFEGGVDGRIEERKQDTGAPVLVLFFVSCPLSFVSWFLFAVPGIVTCSSSFKKKGSVARGSSGGSPTKSQGFFF